MRACRFQHFAILVAVIPTMILSACGSDSPSKPGPDVSAAPAVPELVTPYVAGHPDVSHDGSRLAMTLNLGELAIANIDGSQLDTLSAGGAGDPDWSPDGAHIVDDGGGVLVLFDVMTKQTSLLGSGDIDGAPDWSPDGAKIAARTTMGGDGIGITTYPGGAWSVLPCVDQNGGTCDGEGPTWAPDGSAIAFEDGLEILRVPSTGGTAVVVVEGLEDVTEPAWSPDGLWIAFVVDSIDGGSFPQQSYAHIWVADARGMQYGLRQITYGPYDDGSPTWSSDSRTIFWASDRSGFGAIWKTTFQP